MFIGYASADSAPLFGGYFEDSKCSTPYATAASSHNLQTLAAAIKVLIRDVDYGAVGLCMCIFALVFCRVEPRDLQAAGLTSVLDDSSAAITVFAPTDDAFSALASTLSLTAAELLAKSDLLKEVSPSITTS